MNTHLTTVDRAEYVAFEARLLASDVPHVFRPVESESINAMQTLHMDTNKLLSQAVYSGYVKREQGSVRYEVWREFWDEGGA